MRMMGMDWGDKTVGLALSDPLGITAQPLMTIRFHDPTEAFVKLLHVIQLHEVHHLIVGLPLTLKGEEGIQVEKVKKTMKAFDAYLKKRGRKISTTFWDERLTTFEAERTLLEADISRAKRKKVIDKMAASLILKGYLDSHQV
ncbi:MAG: Holliday junction DNA helicase RuvA [Deltaproteobacteria bacterium RIFCSPLOWO2_12_FULL_40_28]|nr:MAG: Holliday junction DNA helicase RuvA [Deltaproteobacteria bacterium RIFCSPHIGHO2_02_FULL_40_28]OGQ21168.1 MAG: Holliday junction DNA helicase RuvA [Deltaproteobacteria bacterium RIFCSPHIGHO2_12_FULL_40_32]OGQ39069.1 MAG: Holliday junction DNA helicase RuvA [Deltaproteobacteria bacterium RIFCSPLOWO2_02_FULL_40_36]OGQ53142.1 MAG: Holliday junction DNA helicase RuvA [Deltaproteobacteria bacterium RIFCSPLOWO2_12_FULL_40_28]